tara:strand:- start:56 stop:1084 length:1029 start_codon:yes stop_codon:yes gene_type:complete
MAESTLSPTIEDIRLEVQRFLGWGRTALGAGDAKNDVDAILKRGLRQFYAPAVLPGESSAHEWSFMQPVANLTVRAPYSTSTVTVVDGVVTLAGSNVFPTYSAQFGNVFTVGGNEYTVASRDSNTQLTLTDQTSDNDHAAGSEYSLKFPKYELPDAFGGIVGPITYQRESGEEEIRIVSENYIRELEQNTGQTDDAPRYAAVRPRNDFGDTIVAAGDPEEGSRFELLVWPSPDADYVLTYRYTFLINKLIDDDGNYPPGGTLHGETIMASCLAVAELYAPEESTRYRQDYLTRLVASVALDRQSNTAEYYGYNADRSDSQVFVKKRLNRATYTDKLGNIYPS